VAKKLSSTHSRSGSNSSSPPPSWSSLGAGLAGTLFTVWGYLHKDGASSQLSVIADALSVIVPLLFIVGLAGFYAWGQRRVGRQLGRAGFVVAFVSSGLGAFYRLADIGGIVSTADRYGYAVGRGWPPQLLDWFPWFLIGLTLVGIATLRTELLRGWGFLLTAIGLSGWAYYLSDFGSVIQLRTFHVLSGVLFSLGWVLLGYLLWSERS
jgi:hypothetical protein